FEQYVKEYYAILNQNNLDDLIPFHFSDDISTIFIEELNKLGYIFLENLVINELSKHNKGDFEFKINDLKISDESINNIWYEINQENYKEILKNFDLINPLTIQIPINQEQSDIFCYFLPQTNDQNIFQMKFFDEIITTRLLKNEIIVKGDAYFLLDEIREKLEIEFDKLIKFYDLVKQEHFLSSTRIRKYLNKKLNDNEFLKNFRILNPFINEKIQNDPILSKYQLFNPNKMDISSAEKHIRLKLSKKELLSLDGLYDFKHIASMHDITIKIKSTKINYKYSFDALDQYGIVYIELLKYYFENNDEYSSENFLNIDYDQFTTRTFQKYENSKYIKEIKRNLRNLNVFKNYLREVNGILKNIESK
ncbi:MAG: hypothetical protein ACTSQG_10045, partial [Promethearchaeota archaeon]